MSEFGNAMRKFAVGGPAPGDRRMSDLVAALRDYSRQDTDELMDKAADEIARLREELAELAAKNFQHHAENSGLRMENERLTAIIANVCLSLGYEESAWAANWENEPLRQKLMNQSTNAGSDTRQDP